MSEWKQYRAGRRWRAFETGEIEIEGSGLLRTGGQPETMRRMWEEFSAAIKAAHGRFPDVHPAHIMATIAVESSRRAGSLSRDPRALRLEPGYKSDEETPHRVSPGLMQTLISTARDTAKRYGLEHLRHVGRKDLYVAETSILLGTAYMHYQRARYDGDPMLSDAAYNAGSVRRDDDNPFGWMTYHTNRAQLFARWANDAAVVLRERGM